MMRRWSSLFVLLGLIWLWPLPQGQATRLYVKKKLQKYVVNANRAGYRMANRSYRKGWILGWRDRSKIAVYRIPLHPGYEYKIIAVGCKQVQDLDLYLADPRGWPRKKRTLAKDAAGDNVPVITWTPRFRGRYVLLLRMSKVRKPWSGGHFAFALMRKPLQKPTSRPRGRMI